MEGWVRFDVPGVDIRCTTWYTVYGDLNDASHPPLVILHGGPGAVNDYLLPLTELVETYHIPMVFYDQLGSGQSTHLPEKNGDTTFWTEQLFIDQLNGLLDHLGIQDKYDLFGHWWGGMLGARFASSRPKGLRRLILANAPASTDLWLDAVTKLRAQLPEDVQAVLDGTTDSQEYRDAIAVFNKKHLCRMDPFPYEVLEVLKAPGPMNDSTVYGTMWGPSKFVVTGSLRNWTVVNVVDNINVPTLLLNGRYDEVQDSAVQPFFRSLPKVKWYTFAESSHVPFIEEWARHIQLLGEFLTQEM